LLKLGGVRPRRASVLTLVFSTSSGSRRDKDNARERVIRPVVAAAEALLAARGFRPCPPASPRTCLRSPRPAAVRVRGTWTGLNELIAS
jgi:hypothetical protein